MEKCSNRFQKKNNFYIYSIPSTNLNANWKPLSKNMKDDFRFLVISQPQNNEIRIDNNLGEQSFWNTIDFKENIEDGQERVEHEEL